MIVTPRAANLIPNYWAASPTNCIKQIEHPIKYTILNESHATMLHNSYSYKHKLCMSQN